jgi:hypothetical protein
VEKSWTGLNVNLAGVREKIVQFFERKDFGDIIGVKTERGHEIIVGDSKHYKIQNEVCVKIEGEPNDFSISLQTCKEEKGFAFPMILTSMFGGGYFMLKSLKSKEAMQALDRDFRREIDDIVAKCANMADSQNTKED